MAPAGWVTAYAVVDLAFIVTYAVGLGHALRRARPVSGPIRPLLTWAFWLLVAGALADCVESLLLWRLASGDPYPQVLVAASTLKWAALAAAVVLAVLAHRHTHDHPRGESSPSPFTGNDLVRPTNAVGRVLRALYTHRFSLLVVVPFGILGVAKGSDILDQLPDVQRQWVDDGPLAHVVVGTVLTAVVALIVLVIGRLRSHHVAMRVLGRSAPYTPPALLPWLVTTALLAVGAAASVALLGGWDVIPVRFGIVLAVPALVWGLSVWIRRRTGSVPWGPYRRPVSRRQSRTTQTVGDVLAVLVLVLPGLGLVRAFTAPVALGDDGAEVVLLVLGLVGALGAWPLGLAAGCALARVGHPSWLVALTPGRNLLEDGSRKARLFGWLPLRPRCRALRRDRAVAALARRAPRGHRGDPPRESPPSPCPWGRRSSCSRRVAPRTSSPVRGPSSCAPRR